MRVAASYIQGHYSHIRFMAEKARDLHPEHTWNYGMVHRGRLSCCVIERISSNAVVSAREAGELNRHGTR